MARPCKFYVVYDMGLAVKVIEGRKAALKGEHPLGGYKDRLRAEEIAAWHNYLAYEPGGHLAHLAPRDKSPL